MGAGKTQSTRPRTCWSLDNASKGRCPRYGLQCGGALQRTFFPSTNFSNPLRDMIFTLASATSPYADVFQNSSFRSFAPITYKIVKEVNMHFVIGAPQRIGPPAQKWKTNNEQLEARILNVRSPRKRPRRKSSRPQDRRHRSPDHDTASGRVMVLLVPEGYQIPRDINSGEYRVFVRFTRRRKG